MMGAVEDFNQARGRGELISRVAHLRIIGRKTKTITKKKTTKYAQTKPNLRHSRLELATRPTCEPPAKHWSHD
jgi:hypothetical protein